MAIIKIEFNGEKAKLDSALNAFSLQHGWEYQVVDPKDDTKMIDNPTSSLDFARLIMANFVRESVTAYGAKASAEAAKATAIAATKLDLDTMTTTVTKV